MTRTREFPVAAVLRTGCTDIAVLDGLPTSTTESLYHRLQRVSVQTFLEISAGLETLPPRVVEQIKDLQLEYARNLDDKSRKQEIAEAVTALLFKPGATR